MAVNGSTQVVSITGTVSTVAISLVTFGFTAAQVAAADRVFISVGANALRVQWDHPTANPPTTTAGLRLPTNNFPIFEASADATVTVVLVED